MITLSWRSIIQIIAFGVVLGYWLSMKMGNLFMWLLDFNATYPKRTMPLVICALALIELVVWKL